MMFVRGSKMSPCTPMSISTVGMDLHEALAVHRRHDLRVVVALDLDHRADQRHRDAVELGGFVDVLVVAMEPLGRVCRSRRPCRSAAHRCGRRLAALGRRAVQDLLPLAAAARLDVREVDDPVVVGPRVDVAASGNRRSRRRASQRPARAPHEPIVPCSRRRSQKLYGPPSHGRATRDRLPRHRIGHRGTQLRAARRRARPRRRRARRSAATTRTRTGRRAASPRCSRRTTASSSTSRTRSSPAMACAIARSSSCASTTGPAQVQRLLDVGVRLARDRGRRSSTSAAKARTRGIASCTGKTSPAARSSAR